MKYGIYTFLALLCCHLFPDQVDRDVNAFIFSGNFDSKTPIEHQSPTKKPDTYLPGPVLFHHHSFDDFSRGNFSDAGGNLYVSKNGNIQFVNLFDLNFDGYPEVIINNDHNIFEAPDALVYYNRNDVGLQSLFPAHAADAPAWQTFTSMQQNLASVTQLPTEGGGRSVMADLNLDGYKDLVFVNFIHGSTLASIPGYIYWGGKDGLNPLRRSLLPADRGVSVAIDDVTGDGLPDIVVANAGREHMGLETPDFSHDALDKNAGDREKTSYLFRQTEGGFTLQNRDDISTSYAVDVKIADLDNDGRKELIFLELGVPGAVRIVSYADGKTSTRQLIPVIAPKPLATGRRISQELLVKDLNGDGYADIFAPSAGGQSEIFWNNKGRFTASEKSLLKVSNAMSADAADLNDDGLTDLVIASYFATGKNGNPDYETSSYIWWGGKQGFAAEKTTALPTLGAVSVRIADVNNTGRNDILFAQFRDNKTLDVPSYVYLNSAAGFFPENRIELQGFGAVSILAEDLDGNDRKEVMLVNSMSGKAYHSGIEDGAGNDSLDVNGLPMYIYKGNPNKLYSNVNLLRVPQSSAETNMSFADMDDDGKADLIHLRGGGRRLTIRYNVYSYPDTKNLLTEISIPFRANTANVADFNKDGILDVLVTPIVGPEGLFFWGQGNRKYRTERFDFPHFAYSCSIGDINNDGWLDAVTSSHKEICILKGRNSNNNFSFAKPEVINTDMLTTRVSMADFNNDGWADIWAQNLQNTLTKFYDVQSWILVNNKGNFSAGNKRSFSTFGANGGSIANLYNDDTLAVVVSNYHAEASRRTGVFVMKSNADGFPSDNNRLRLPAYSSGANIVMDFNGDGYQDIMVYNHTGNEIYNGGLNPSGGTHGVGSFMYWGGKDGFNMKDKTWIASFGPHSRIMADAGSPLKRNPYEVFTSELLSNKTLNESFILTIEGRFNSRQFVESAILINGSEPVKPQEISKSDSIISYKVRIPKQQQFRYALKLHSSNSGSGPLVRSVRMQAAEAP